MERESAGVKLLQRRLGRAVLGADVEQHVRRRVESDKHARIVAERSQHPRERHPGDVEAIDRRRRVVDVDVAPVVFRDTRRDIDQVNAARRVADRVKRLFRGLRIVVEERDCPHVVERDSVLREDRLQSVKVRVEQVDLQKRPGSNSVAADVCVKVGRRRRAGVGVRLRGLIEREAGHLDGRIGIGLEVARHRRHHLRAQVVCEELCPDRTGRRRARQTADREIQQTIDRREIRRRHILNAQHTPELTPRGRRDLGRQVIQHRRGRTGRAKAEELHDRIGLRAADGKRQHVEAIRVADKVGRQRIDVDVGVARRVAREAVAGHVVDDAQRQAREVHRDNSVIFARRDRTAQRRRGHEAIARDRARRRVDLDQL